jgi:hypothetical protein
MEYTVSMNYPIDSWEFGNVLCENFLCAALEIESIFHPCNAYKSFCARVLGNELSGSGIGASVGATIWKGHN